MAVIVNIGRKRKNAVVVVLVVVIVGCSSRGRIDSNMIVSSAGTRVSNSQKMLRKKAGLDAEIDLSGAWVVVGASAPVQEDLQKAWLTEQEMW